MTNPHEAALEAAALALDGTGLLEGDESRSAARASVEAYLTSMREAGRVMVPVEATPRMLAAVLPHIKDGDARDYRLAEQACALLGANIPAGELAAVELSRDYRNLIVAAAQEGE